MLLLVCRWQLDRREDNLIMILRSIIAAIAALLCLYCRCATSFQAIRSSTIIRPCLQAAGDGHEEVIFTEQGDELDELSRPSISFTRNSILFDEDAPTQRDNGPLRVWRSTKSFLPAFKKQ